MSIWCRLGIHNWNPVGPERRQCFDCPKRQRLEKYAEDGSGPLKMDHWVDEE